jgi:hypothetical protein
VASVRFVYPNVPIRLLIGGRVGSGFLNELHRSWGVEVAAVTPGNYGWGFVKLEPLFGKAGERFLVLDSDTVLVGPVLQLFDECSVPFLVDDESQTEEDTKRLYYDWEKFRSIDPEGSRPRFVFNSGQWFGTSGFLQRDDFSPWINWEMPRTLRHPEIFMPGDQGVLNYVLNKKARLVESAVVRRKIMRWPGHSLDDLNLAEIARGKESPFLQIVHWAGFKAPRLESLPRADLLIFFEKCYYSQQGAKGERLRLRRAGRGALQYNVRKLRTKLWQRTQKAIGA